MKLLFLVAIYLAICQSVRLVEKEFFWYQTEDGNVIPAFLKERSEIAPNLVRNVEEEVFFWHYLTGEKEGRQISPNCTDCLSEITRDLPLIIGAHGFGSSYNRGLSRHIQKGLKERKIQANLILIDWSRPAAPISYPTAVSNVKPVGEYVAKMVNFLLQEGIASLDQTYFVGHSLGAHMANFVAKDLVNGEKFRTIFALDPAWPLFGQREESERLDSSDAEFVNVIHTSIGYLGFEEPLGHVDFYPNGGKHQPGCLIEFIGACSHSRSYKLLGESIGRPGSFPACKCDNWEEYEEDRCTCEQTTLMGWDTPSDTRGYFFLSTNGKAPYGHGEEDEESE